MALLLPPLEAFEVVDIFCETLACMELMQEERLSIHEKMDRTPVGSGFEVAT